MSQYTSVEEAIANGSSFYWNQEHLENGRSGGTQCPKCREWTKLPRKRKEAQCVYLDDCGKCEIKDPFARLWHNFNRRCTDDERELYNCWLRALRHELMELTYDARRQAELRTLINKLPFFGA
jgi:hypothetical protein